MLETDRLTLTPVEAKDTADVARLYADPDVMRYIYGRPLPPEIAVESVTRALQHWKENRFGMFSLFLRESNEFVGRCGLIRIRGTEDVEVAYVLRKQDWGKGYATEAARVCVDFGFKQIGLQEIIGLTFLDNTASQNVLQKCGLQFCGTRHHFGHNLLLFTRTSPF